MSDPQPDRLKSRPRRAEPLQPDKPGGDDGVMPETAPDADAQRDAARQQKEQSDAAHENTREGYGD